MNAAFIGVGAAFIAIGAASLARAKSAADETAANNARLSGVLMMVAAALFFVAGLLPLITD